MTKMWSALCALFVLSAFVLRSLFEDAGVDFTPGHWVGLIVWLLWTFFGAAVVWTFLSEREPRAAGVSAVVFGAGSAVLAGLILIIVRVALA